MAWLCTGQLYAQQKKEFIFDHYNPGDILPSSQVLSLSQGVDKTLWLGTENGLLSFDGHQFKRWRNPYVNKLKLSAEYVSTVVADKHNQIWFVGHGRLYRLHPKMAKVDTFHIPGFTFDPVVTKLKYDVDKDLLYLLTHKGVFHTPTLQHDIKGIEPLNKLSRKKFSDLVWTPRSGLWLVRPDSLIHYDPSKQKIQRFDAEFWHDQKKLKFDYLNLNYDGHQNLWIGTWSMGLLKFDINNHQFKHYHWTSLTENQNTIQQVLLPPVTDEYKTFWVFTNHGLQLFNTTDGTFTSYQSFNPSDPKTVHGTAFCGLIDKRKNTWIGTYYGLHKFDVNKQSFTHFTTPTLANLVQSVESMVFYGGQQKDSLAFIAFSYGPMIHLDLYRGKDLPLPTALSSYADPSCLIHEAYLDDNRYLWVSSVKKGLIRYQLDSKKMEKLNTTFSGVEDQILYIFNAPDHKIWMYGIHHVYVYDEKSNTLVPQLELSAWIKSHNYYSMMVDASFDDRHLLWVILYNNTTDQRAIVSYDVVNKNIHEYKSNDIPALFTIGSLESIRHVKENNMVVGGENGIAFFKAGDQKINNIQSLFKTDKNIIGGYKLIQISDEHDIWLNSSFGLAYTRLYRNSLIHFTYQNSSLSTMPDPYIIIGPDGKTLWVRQEGGFKKAGIETLLRKVADSILLTSIHIKNSEDIGYRPMQKVFSLKYDQNTIEMHFSLYNFSGSDANHFEYRLNQEGRWLAMESNTLLLSNMGPGQYHITVRGINEYGIVSPNVLQYEFHISPPFWKSSWFFFLLLLSAIAVIAAIYNIRDRQRKRLEDLRNSIARDLHDEMGSTLSQINMMSELLALKSKDQNYTTINQKVKEVMSTMSEIVWSINPKKDSLVETISKIQEFAIEMLESKGIDLHFTISSGLEEKLSPDQRRHIYLIFKEAINNAAKYSEANNAWFTVDHHPKKIALSFADDGKGFDASSVKAGNGLTTMAERARAAGFKLQIRSNEKGTQILLYL
jgi:signal transduction histidine kinase/ligand-binding sensor domain-containing protein